ncbi:DUF1178 family protein [Hansschlegelia sp.]|uniref:DUF1178 family protein n=1 Tax=Hansschlegelia sp. TaxID=2041892 RepID=UPI002CC4EFA7|nr:DUF1178 family protein [Hansschlegelia sp.]HVI28604.1 DUF1178 family protein [Hansschlegelia sp.]
MIRYDLLCGDGHGFDAWFRSASDFDSQEARGLLSCPACGSVDVRKALMAPALASARSRGGDEPVTPEAESPPVSLVSGRDEKLRGLLRELKAHVRQTSEDVGERFPEVARQMHAEEIEHRPIRGRATAQEAKALLEEGVPVYPLPAFPEDEN